MQAIRTEKVTKSFGKKEVLSGIDLSISKGEIFGLLGPYGAGKATLINALTGQKYKEAEIILFTTILHNNLCLCYNIST